MARGDRELDFSGVLVELATSLSLSLWPLQFFLLEKLAFYLVTHSSPNHEIKGTTFF